MDGLDIAIQTLEQRLMAINTALSALRMTEPMTAEPAASATPVPEPSGKKKYKFSDAARERMKLAQQKRYAHLHKEEPAPVVTEKKPKFSEAAKKKLALAMKRRWAAKRAASAVVAKKAVKKGRKKAAVDNEVPF